jgi:hypothetical protein
VVWFMGGRSDDGSFDGGAAGNLTDGEKAREAGRDVAGKAGVLGAVALPDSLRAGRVGRANSCEGSRAMGGEKLPPASGE